MTLQSLIDQLQALAHEGHAQEEVFVVDIEGDVLCVDDVTPQYGGKQKAIMIWTTCV